MKPHPISKRFTLFSLISLVTILSWGKNGDILHGNTTEELETLIEENQGYSVNKNKEEIEDDVIKAVIEEEEVAARRVVTHTTAFSPIHDANLQAGKGFNHNINAQNVWVRNSEFSKSNGTLPEAGVDLEPNNSSERLVNINFINCKFSNNDNMGFFVSTGKMKSSSMPISVKVSGCEFSYNAKSPDKGRPRAGIHLSHGSTSNPVKGEVLFERAFFNGSNHRVLFSRKSAKAYRAVFRDCTAKGVAKRGESAVISLEMLSSAQTLGGFVFDNFTIEYDRDIPFMRIGGPASKTLMDLRGTFIIKELNDNPMKYLWA